MKFIIKEGDILYCIKDVVDQNGETIMSSNCKYKVNDIYYTTSCIDVKEKFIVSIYYNNEHYYPFWFDFKSDVNHHCVYDYFLDINNYRKMKLKKLNEL